ncbi:uncharacterized protein [Apostichopus japonicus]|uniref:uncharacterized protein isoform X2 n=1 Tax=Stichopus japonicus TaxID=307972 RepID=UPI003AB6EBA9
MKKTYGNRMLWITNESPTLAEILQKYPRYIDVEGLVNQDLQMKFGDEVSRQLLMKWDSSIAPVILKLAEQTSTTAIRELFMEFNENKDSSSYDCLGMYALLICVFMLLPMPGAKECANSR